MFRPVFFVDATRSMAPARKHLFIQVVFSEEIRLQWLGSTSHEPMLAKTSNESRKEKERRR